jgi:myo-inositol 2-dehydrogenase / D-chiro-inositol 1-dehydrogenase
MSFHICLIGCGGIATGYHGPSYVRYALGRSDIVLAACCDLDAQRAATFRERFGFARSYADFEAMLLAEKPDAVCLAVPPHVTCEIVCAILAQGYPLLTEKPPGLNVAEIDRMIAAADASGAPVQVAFNRRNTPLVRELKRQLAKQAGRTQYIRYDFTRVGRTDPDFSTTAIHGIDTARYIAGSDYAAIRFTYQLFPEPGPAVANVFMDCTFESGACGHLDFCPVAGIVTERATVHAEDNTYFLSLPIWNGPDSPGRLQRLERGKIVYNHDGYGITGSGEDYILNGFYGENESFFEAVRAGQMPEDDLYSARQSVEVMQSIRGRKSYYP